MIASRPFATLFPLSLFALLAAHANAQSSKLAPAADPIFQTIQALDRALFDAYNGCDLEKLSTLVAEDLEFYHDQTGLATGKPVFLESIKKNICGKVRRELVPGALEVYRLNGYGAVETGVHRFHHPGHDETEPIGEAKFVMLWQNKQGEWKLTRVISYGHAAAK